MSKSCEHDVGFVAGGKCLAKTERKWVNWMQGRAKARGTEWNGNVHCIVCSCVSAMLCFWLNTVAPNSPFAHFSLSVAGRLNFGCHQSVWRSCYDNDCVWLRWIKTSDAEIAALLFLGNNLDMLIILCKVCCKKKTLFNFIMFLQ